MTDTQFKAYLNKLRIRGKLKKSEADALSRALQKGELKVETDIPLIVASDAFEFFTDSDEKQAIRDLAKHGLRI